MMEELEKCPFCGGDAEIERMGTHSVSMIITCEDCGASVESGETWINEHSKWNHRAHPKYKRVDLFNILKEIRSSNRLVDKVQFETICDIKSKYGDLYVEVK